MSWSQFARQTPQIVATYLDSRRWLEPIFRWLFKTTSTARAPIMPGTLPNMSWRSLLACTFGKQGHVLETLDWKYSDTCRWVLWGQKQLRRELRRKTTGLLRREMNGYGRQQRAQLLEGMVPGCISSWSRHRGSLAVALRRVYKPMGKHFWDSLNHQTPF